MKNASGRSLPVQWQAHRGGGGIERPDNTEAAFLYSWSLGGIPEADVRQTLDGRIVCLHDATLARTTDAGPDIADVPVASLRYEQLAGVDAGSKYAAGYAGQRVPLLAQVFARMAEAPARRMYLDLKSVDLAVLASMIRRFGLEGRTYAASSDPEKCRALKSLLPTTKTLLWCGGTATEIEGKLRAAASSGFSHLDQVQLHLNDAPEARGWRYEVGLELVAEALAACSRYGVDLEVFPWKFEAVDIARLLDLGVRWYATDEPSRFLKAVRRWQAG